MYLQKPVLIQIILGRDYEETEAAFNGQGVVFKDRRGEEIGPIDSTRPRLWSLHIEGEQHLM
jgi:hypothetical protein